MKNTHLLQIIGNTPLIKLEKILQNENVNLFAKLEGQNPSGSIKDRVALYMILQAEKRKELKKNQTILEATSGNMGISLAMIGAQKGYQVEIVMSEGMSEERKVMLRAFGAKLHLTPKELGTHGAIQKAQELKKQNPQKYWFANQFNNPDNPKAHYFGIAPELHRQIKKIDYLILGVGTSGTAMGIAKFFKKYSPKTKILEVSPTSGYEIQGLQNQEKDFSGLIYKNDAIIEKNIVNPQDAYQMSRDVSKKEGLFVGMSTGANLYVAQKISKKIKRGTIVLLVPDRGEKYLSTSLFK
jgi:cysteine synthase B